MITSDVLQRNGQIQKNHPLKKLKDDIIKWMKRVPVLGFNSSSYDTNLYKTHLIRHSVNMKSFVKSSTSKINESISSNEEKDHIDNLNELLDGDLTNDDDEDILFDLDLVPEFDIDDISHLDDDDESRELDMNINDE